ncbi:hypothetical protein NX794_19980 [Streptomyces sp. LP11]|uniref:Uncharacterized protein n=1 Tax=Streptomyces pyxinicus TaxID=2970331 RepID=A0ABT2B4N0_9ACTN|nr:hypothetical protein [Streptomyces sp. LP11]MCS0603477.1 hypothetical protein [Streptomyces sp. LP11]
MTRTTPTDIALLLADVADEVEIGAAPVQAVIRGGRRRRARRWAVAAATTLVLAGSTGATLMAAGLPGEHRTTATQLPVSPQTRHVYVPQRTELAHGVDRGTNWRVEFSVWEAPRDDEEASGQAAAMKAYGVLQPVTKERQLVGSTSYFVSLYYGDERRPRVLVLDTVQKWDAMSGHDVVYNSVPLKRSDAAGADRLVVGRVARTAQQVRCTWTDGTDTTVRPTPAGGSPVNWFVCVGPVGKGNETAAVTR